MNTSIKIKRGELIVYIIIWLIVLLMPVFISKTDYGIDKAQIGKGWIHALPYLFIFIVHNFFLFPNFFIENKRLWYFGLTFLLIFLSGLLGRYFFGFFDIPGGRIPNGPPMDGPSFGPEPPMGTPMGMEHPPRQSMGIDFINNLFVSVLVVGFNAAIKLTVKWQDEEQKNKELEKEKLQTELALLKNQVSPHFFMNTLNNIHALIDINSEDAKESIIKLSKLMRYLLYDTEKGKTTLSKEIEFIKSYVDLMKLRFTSKIKVQLSFPEFVCDTELPPMLFTSLVENAFKHGISYQTESYVNIALNIDDTHLYFSIKNSLHQNKTPELEKGGIGLINLQKQLELIYGSRYVLTRNETENSFEVNIKIPINGN